MHTQEPPITQDRLKELLDYNPETGVFTAKVIRRGAGGQVGDAVGTYSPKEGMIVRLDGKRLHLHNLAWLWVHNEWPVRQLMKLDGDSRNTRIGNLALFEAGARGKLTQVRLRGLLDYDSEAGTFRWKIRPAKNVAPGSEAGRTEKSNGNRYISVDGVDYTAQRLAWLFVHGELPERPLRFLDGNALNLAINNLALPEYDARTPDGRRAYERDSRERRFHVIRAGAIRTAFGMDMGVYQQLFVEQKGLCAICEKPETATRAGKVKWLAIDHCHDSNAVRGLLCQGCNTGLGALGDDPERLERAAAYIRKARQDQADNVVRFVKKDTT